MYTGEIALEQLVRFGLSLAVFVWPGMRAIRLWDQARRLTLLEQLALGFVISLGFFGLLVSGPLLTHQSTRFALAVVLTGWVVFVGGTMALRRRSAAPAEASVTPSVVPDRRSALLQGFSLGLGLVSAAVFARDAIPRRLGLMLCLIGFVAAAAIGWVLQQRVANAEEDRAFQRVSRLAMGIGLPLLFFQLVSTTVCGREDWDDALYLSEALTLVDADRMLEFSPVHRGEQLPATVLYALPVFELFGALLGRLSGIHTLIVFRTLFAPAALSIALILYSAILRRVLPRYLVPVGLLVLGAYFTWGMSSYWTANNYLLPRPAQGKTWLIHVAVPALVLLADEWFRRPAPWTLALVGLASVAALGMAPTAVVLVPCLLVVTALVRLVPIWAAILRDALRVRLARTGLGRGRLALLVRSIPGVPPDPVKDPPRRSRAAGTRTWLWAGLLVLAALPQAAFSVYVTLAGAMERTDLTIGETGSRPFVDLFLFYHLNFRDNGGALEAFCLVAAPLLWANAGRWGRTYPLGFLGLLFATVLNPALTPLLTAKLDPEVYHRIFWLIPLPVLIACAGALGVSLATSRLGLFGGVGALVVCLGAMPLVGGRFVWLPGHLDGRGRCECLTNAYKVPSPVLAFANILASRPLGPDRRLLCEEATAVHLAPLVEGLDFVYVRSFQTIAPLALLGRGAEAEQRRLLAEEFLRGELPVPDAVALLLRSKAAYVATGEVPPATREALRSAGFTPTRVEGAGELWERASPAAAPSAQPRGSVSLRVPELSAISQGTSALLAEPEHPLDSTEER